MNARYQTIILEDDMVARMLLENYCSNHPQIDLKGDFDNINEAKDYLAGHQVDLVLLDIELNGSNGFELIPFLDSNTHVIITTADPNNIVRANQLGIDNVLIKPIGLEDFLWSVKKLNEA